MRWRVADGMMRWRFRKVSDTDLVMKEEKNLKVRQLGRITLIHNTECLQGASFFAVVT